MPRRDLLNMWQDDVGRLWPTRRPGDEERAGEPAVQLLQGRSGSRSPGDLQSYLRALSHHAAAETATNAFRQVGTRARREKTS